MRSRVVSQSPTWNKQNFNMSHRTLQWCCRLYIQSLYYTCLAKDNSSKVSCSFINVFGNGMLQQQNKWSHRGHIVSYKYKETSEMCDMQICHVLDLTSHQETRPIPLVIGRDTKWRWFWCDFPYFNRAQKIEDFTRSKHFCAVILNKMW